MIDIFSFLSNEKFTKLCIQTIQQDNVMIFFFFFSV